MRAMKGTRSVARLALFALGFAALLPLLASARMLVADGPVEHCHRLNIDSVIDTDPAAPEGPSQPRKASCPFCTFAAAASPSPPSVLPCFIPVDLGFAPGPHAAETPCGTEVELPLSRAPPERARA